MKLPADSLTPEQRLEEFDVWITSSIQEITDTAIYQSEIRKISLILDSLGLATNGFASVSDCNADRMAVYCIREIEALIKKPNDNDARLSEAVNVIDSLISMLFLVTGKSDNNMKCQFPVFLFASSGKNEFPVRSKRGARVSFTMRKLGRVIKQETVSKLIAEALCFRGSYSGSIDLEREAVWLLKSYIESILIDDASVQQLWALGTSYFHLKRTSPGFELRLLSPIVTFKVRGQVAAVSGHVPEKILRKYLRMWGLKAGVDYNLSDVIIDGSGTTEDELIEAAKEVDGEAATKAVLTDFDENPTKTRAYDFVLPYKTPGWEQKIFMQAQFYAGDSGSVSHKVVDQTRSSRSLTRTKYPHAIFVEYLDGAGYFSSLRRDLQHMLEMPSTADFVQVRSAHVKLRRQLQNIGFLTPIDFVHALFRARFVLHEAERILVGEGYSTTECNRCKAYCLGEGLMALSGDQLSVNPRLLINARRLLILDSIVIDSKALHDKGLHVFAPGAVQGHGVTLRSVARSYEALVQASLGGASRFSADLTWLQSSGFIKLKTS